MKKIKIFRTYFLNNKKYKSIVYILFFVMLSSISCNEKQFLSEKPLDFYSPENSFVTNADFDQAVVNLHSRFRDFFWGDNQRYYWYCTDIMNYYKDAQAYNYNLDWSAGKISKSQFWNTWWGLIYDANVIIGRSEGPQSKLTADQKLLVQAEAKFFRGYSLKILCNLFGGMPIVTEETAEPKRDYVRASRQETYEQCAEDLKFAADHLQDIDVALEYRINKLAASHVLAEVYVSLGRWQDAINEASKVINHPAMALMTQRFGYKYPAEEVKKFGFFNSSTDNSNTYGDVFWDLFAPGNQDRSKGNKEALWVIQFAWLVPGGGGNGLILSRLATPDLTKCNIKQSNGKNSPVLQNPNTYYDGRGQGFCSPTWYLSHTVWERSGWDQDIRNAKHNFIRDVKVNNPSNQYNGKWVVADKIPRVIAVDTDTLRNWFPFVGKAITPSADPKDLWLTDQTVPGSLTGLAQTTFRKHYQIRLAETYLLRAEAYLGKGDAINAANDLNVVRKRAQAPNVAPDKVDIDYILDERLRELNFEELRLATLNRLGSNIRRLRAMKSPNMWSLDDHNNLLAIPLDEILKNVEAPLVQNPGY